MQSSQFPRAIRPAPTPLGLYFRAGRNDHTALSQLISSGQRSFFGIVFEAGRVRRHKELIELVEKSRLECILDPCTQPSATVGGYSKKSHGELPWGLNRPHLHGDFQGANQRRVLTSLAEFIIQHGFTQTLAPTHLIHDAKDDWLSIDVEVAHRLREQLDRVGGKKVGLIYSLSMPYALFRDENAREKIIATLDGLPAQSIWLKVDGCGSNSSSAAVRNYVEAVSDFHHLDLPIVGDQVGGLVGLSFLALSAVGGIAHGVTVGERFNSQHWRHPPTGKAHMLHPRVYFPSLDMYMEPARAKSLLDATGRLRAHLGCSDQDCCPRGIVDMIENPSRHFLIQRMKQVSNLSQIPEQIRSREFLERYVRPTTDQVLRLASSTQLDERMQKRFMAHRKRLDALRVLLGNLVQSKSMKTHSSIPVTRAAREARV